ncbi:hypothetical protein PLICRDRAFT_52334 [Plicaturopsis crispa FD-325 SS-3]|nr:hypothetical protein PLICRDRAFT_52334 [Plicaturopsis crispa FD-325 SS-3]
MSGGGSGEKDEGLSPHLRNIALPGPPRRQGPYPEEEEEQQGRRETYPPRYAPSSAFHSQATAPRETPFGSLLPAVFGEHPGPSRRGDEQSARPSGPSWSQASWAPPPDPLAQSSRGQSVRSSQSSYTDPHRGPYHEDERARMAGPSSQREPSPPRRIVREPQGYHHYDDHGRVASESERYYTSRSQEAFVGPSTHRARPVPPADTSSIPHGSQIRPAHRDPGFRTAAAPQSVPVHTQVQLPSIETLLDIIRLDRRISRNRGTMLGKFRACSKQRRANIGLLPHVRRLRS